jgi:fatty-acyl-CoA synthase
MTGNSPDRGSPSLKAWVRALEMTAPIARNRFATFPVLIDTLADKFGPAIAILSEHDCLTYRELAERSNRYARWALEQGIARGDVVCLFMPNCADYMAIWLGITRIGGIVSLVNTNLAGESLTHSISIVNPKHVIVGAELVDAFAAVPPRLARGIRSGCMVRVTSISRALTMRFSCLQAIGSTFQSLSLHLLRIWHSTFTRQALPVCPRLLTLAIFV